MISHPQISIIVPIYNAEKYLSKCLDSILAQTFDDWECILVNDASPDGVGGVISEYAQRNSRFKVITKTVNGGVSRARQTGLDNAVGKYVIHADPDDTVNKDWLKVLYHTAENEQADMTICDFERVYANKTVICPQKPSSLNNEDILEDFLTDRLWGSTWNKLVKRDCFTKWKISFHPEMNLMEDSYVICKLLICGAKVAYVPQVLYYYDSKSNPNSIILYRKYEHVRSVTLFVDDISPLLKQPRYDEGWYHRKRLVKVYLFQIHASQDEITQTYQEINTRVIEDGKKANPLSCYHCLALAIKGHTRLAYLLYRIRNMICRWFLGKKDSIYAAEIKNDVPMKVANPIYDVVFTDQSPHANYEDLNGKSMGIAKTYSKKGLNI